LTSFFLFSDCFRSLNTIHELDPRNREPGIILHLSLTLFHLALSALTDDIMTSSLIPFIIAYSIEAAFRLNTLCLYLQVLLLIVLFGV